MSQYPGPGQYPNPQWLPIQAPPWINPKAGKTLRGWGIALWIAGTSVIALYWTALFFDSLDPYDGDGRGSVSLLDIAFTTLIPWGALVIAGISMQAEANRRIRATQLALWRMSQNYGNQWYWH